jgi:aspartate/methionine/tyrosine aminotransferase
MPEFQPFVMERMMSKFEQEVEYNLSESGVHPLKLSELLADDPDYVKHLLDTVLNYPYVNGTPELRQNISALYKGAGPDNVLVTVGAAEANYITLRTLLSAGDEIVLMLPNYMQIWGIAKNHGLKIKTFNLCESKGWAPDLEELDKLVTADTKLIAVCNPNNPTGYVLSDTEVERIVSIADRARAWILSDEVYSGAERLGDEQTPSLYGSYDKAIAVAGLSKAYGLPGLRTGWIVASPDILDDIWARHEYVTLSATMLANKLAALALSPAVRKRILARNREYVRKGYLTLQNWMDSHEGTFVVTPPQAGAIAFVRYNLGINSTEFVDRLLQEKSVLIIPGDHFGMDNFVRISFGLPHACLTAGLNRIHELIQELG